MSSGHVNNGTIAFKSSGKCGKQFIEHDTADETVAGMLNDIGMGSNKFSKIPKCGIPEFHGLAAVTISIKIYQALSKCIQRQQFVI